MTLLHGANNAMPHDELTVLETRITPCIIFVRLWWFRWYVTTCQLEPARESGRSNDFFRSGFVLYTCVTSNIYDICDGPNVDSERIRRNLRAAGCLSGA